MLCEDIVGQRRTPVGLSSYVFITAMKEACESRDGEVWAVAALDSREDTVHLMPQDTAQSAVWPTGRGWG